MKKTLPILGVGFGLRHKYIKEYKNCLDLIHWLEILTENYFTFAGRNFAQLEGIIEQFPLVAHGINLSIGSYLPLDREYLANLQKLFSLTKPKWFSDHLSFSSAQSGYFNDLIPIQLNQQSLSLIADKINELQDIIQIPFLIENISYYYEYENNKIPEYEFINLLTEKTQCGILLDINNIYVNYQNHQSILPQKYIDNIDLDKVIQIHIAGHTHYDQDIIDTHGEEICLDVWNLLEYIFSRAQPNAVMIERDVNLPPFEEMKKELIKLNNLWHKYFSQNHNPTENDKD